MSQKLIIYVLILGVAVQFSFSESLTSSTSLIAPEQRRLNSNDFVLIKSNRLHHLEHAIKRFLSKLAHHINGSLVLNSRSSNGKDVRSSIREMCQSMREALIQFANECGLTNTVHEYKRSIRNVPLTEDWFSENLLQGAYLLRDIGNMIDEIGASIKLRFDGKKSTAKGKKYLLRKEEGFQFLGIVHNAADFSEKLTDCFLQMSTKSRKPSFSINHALLNIAKDPPKIALETLQTNLNNVSTDQSPKTRATQKYWYIVLCLSLINDQGSYEDCIHDLQNLETCLFTTNEQRLRDKRRNMDSELWVKAIERLSDSEIRMDSAGKVEVLCKSARRVPKKMQQKVKYIFERILDKKITRTSPFHRTVLDLSDTLSRSLWGQKFVNEVYQYCAIFEDGQKKLRSFSKEGRQKEIAKAMQTYKRGILLRTFDAINKMHRSVSTFEQFLIKGIKDVLNETWQSHLKILSSLIDWMSKLLELYSGESVTETGQSSSDTSLEQWDADEGLNEDNNSEVSTETRSKHAIMKEADASMDNLIETMNRVGRYRSLNNNSMLSCLANNLLLVTMFMETIGFISTLYCFDHGTREEQNSMDSNEWNRDRRSIPFSYEQIFNLVSQDYLLWEIRENSTTLIPSEND